jgi:hypothetical protein
VVDPVSVAALVLSIPGAVVALMDVVDRIEKRRRSKAVLERLRAVQNGTPSLRLHIVLPDGPRNVAAIDEDMLLAAAEGARGG